MRRWIARRIGFGLNDPAGDAPVIANQHDANQRARK
jgi:hypothetical protein